MTTLGVDRQELAEDEALTWLLGQPSGRLETSVAELARRFGWNRTKASRRLKRWSDDGHITREVRPGGRSVITLKAPAPDPPAHANALVPASATPTAPAITTPDRPRVHALLMPAPIRSRGRLFRALAAVTLAALAAAIAWYGLRINAWYGASLGKTVQAGTLLAGLSVTADALALFLPAVARALWLDNSRSVGAIAWGLWVLTIAIALLATVGFASVNIADTHAARSRIADQSNGLAARIEQLRVERAGIGEMRSVPTIEAEIQRAQPGAAAAWRVTAGCTDVTRAQSGEACAEVLKLRQALGTAQRRDRLDAELHEAETSLAGLPPVMTADPQAETAAKLLNWLLRADAVTAHDIGMARVLGMTLLPQISGLVFMLAIALWPPGRRREEAA